MTAQNVGASTPYLSFSGANGEISIQNLTLTSDITDISGGTKITMTSPTVKIRNTSSSNPTGTYDNAPNTFITSSGYQVSDSTGVVALSSHITQSAKKYYLISLQEV